MNKIKKISKQQMDEFLLEHPNYFINNEQFLTTVVMPYLLANNNDASSLFAKQIEIMRGQINELSNKLDHFYQQGRINDNLFNITTQIALTIIKSNNVNELLSSLNDCLQQNDFNEFNLKISPDFEQQLSEFPTIAKIVKALDADVISSYNYFNYDEVSFLLKDELVTDMIFLDKKSAVIFAPLKFNNKTIGIFALGSKDPTELAEIENTMFFDFIVMVLKATLTRIFK